MKVFVSFLYLVFSSISGFSQKSVNATSQFTILGLVENPKVITYADLQKEKRVDIGDLKITNHAGEFRKEYKNMKGVPLLILLNDVKIIAPSPKQLSEYYFILKASDGYSVVISWNELFNTEIGNSFFVVTEADGKSLEDSSERILFVASKDFKTGRRHVKGLETIEVKRI